MLGGLVNMQVMLRGVMAAIIFFSLEKGRLATLFQFPSELFLFYELWACLQLTWINFMQLGELPLLANGTACQSLDFASINPLLKIRISLLFSNEWRWVTMSSLHRGWGKSAFCFIGNEKFLIPILDRLVVAVMHLRDHRLNKRRANANEHVASEQP